MVIARLGHSSALTGRGIASTTHSAINAQDRRARHRVGVGGWPVCRTVSEFLANDVPPRMNDMTITRRLLAKPIPERTAAKHAPVPLAACDPELVLKHAHARL